MPRLANCRLTPCGSGLRHHETRLPYTIGGAVLAGRAARQRPSGKGNAVQGFCDWLAGTKISLFIQTTDWIIPATQTLHILCVSIVIASMAMLDLRLLGVAGRRQSIPAMADRLLPWLWYSVIILLLTGMVLITAEPVRELMNSIFRLKMLLLLAGITVTAAFRFALRHDVSRWEATGDARAARVLGVASLVVWVGIIICGRWIAYSQ